MDDKISVYFSMGLKYSEILSCLFEIDGISISVRTLKRKLKRLKLFRRINYSDIADVGIFIMNDIQYSGRLHGYKMMHQKCIQNGFVVTQETVREIMFIIDPSAVERRRRGRLQRRIYLNFGPNYLWHMDSYDKLKPYGICINGAIDGFSRYIVWLQAHTTNSNPKLIAGYFMDTVKMLGGCPSRLRADMGTENSYVRDMMRFLRSSSGDLYSDHCYLVGSSNHNQRIERWWGFLRNQNAQYWMDLFAMLGNLGCFTGNFIDKSVLQFCFMDIIQKELDEIVSLWNNHRIRQNKNQNSPQGRPVVMYSCPSLFGTQDYIRNVPEDYINACAAECINKGLYNCDETVFELCSMFMEDDTLEKPENGEDAVLLYQFLRSKIIEGSFEV